MPKVVRQFLVELQEEFAMLRMVTKKLDDVLRSNSTIEPLVISRLEQMCEQCDIFKESRMPSGVQTVLFSEEAKRTMALHDALHDLRCVANEKAMVSEKLTRAKTLSTKGR